MLICNRNPGVVRKISILVFVACGYWSHDVAALTDAKIQVLKSRLDKQVSKSRISRESLSLYVADPTDSVREVYSLNSEKKMIPASITKVITAVEVLRSFPPGFKFKTQILSEAPQVGETLKGDLILKGGGDPSFVSETMWFLVNVFLRSGVKKIEGDLVVDDTLFDQVRFDDSRQKERVDRAYDAPTGAMSFNWNSVNVFVRPTKAGESAIVFLDPENDFTQLVNTVKTVKAGRKSEVFADRDPDSKTGKDILKVSGSIAEDSSEITMFKNITQPEIWAGENLKQFLKQRGILVSGRVRAGKAPATAKLLAESESKPIELIVADMNKFSNNYVAEMLIKNLGAVQSPPGTIAKGMAQVKKFLQSLGIQDSDYVLQNPSGLTRENRFSSKTLWKVMAHLQQQYSYQPEFVSSLPIAGVDGTLKRRMKGSAGERWVRAKTGYLNGVVSLAGFAGRKDGTVLPFVFIFNGSADESRVRLFFDELATDLVE